MALTFQILRAVQLCSRIGDFPSYSRARREWAAIAINCGTAPGNINSFDGGPS
jgi:hypothetical protein